MEPNGTSDSSGSIDLDDPIVPIVEHSRRKQRVLVLILVSCAVVGGISAFLPEETTVTDSLFALLILILAVVWCHLDASEHSHRMGVAMKLGLVCLFAFAFPIYLFQTRGLSGFKTLAVAALFVAAMVACLFVGGLATFYIADMLSSAIQLGLVNQ